MENYMKLEIAAIGENESFARSAVAAFALSLNPTLAELSDIKTAVSEAVTNCIVHAYKKQPCGKIVIECTLEREEHTGVDGELLRGKGALHIRVADFGCGIEDVEKALTPFYTTLSGEERSGMGFTIMQTFMNDFSLQSEKGKGTQIFMRKNIGEIQSETVGNVVNAG